MTSIGRRIAVGTIHSLAPRHRRPPVGAAPGTLVPADDTRPPRIRLITYGPDRAMEERTLDDPDELRALPRDGVAWIDVEGLGDEKLLTSLGEIFELHPLALADAVNVPQRPKSEVYEHFHLFITRMVRLDARREICGEQLSIFFGPHFVLTLQEEQGGDVFDPVRRRLAAAGGTIREAGADYLAYTLIDTVIDGYYPPIEAIGDRLHETEEAILECPTTAGLRQIHQLRRELLGLRRAVWPQREAVNALVRDESTRIDHSVRQYLRDTYDHTVQIADTIETYRELATSLMDIYLSSVSQRTNDVMKVLTVMTSIFIPLSFLAGVYGMNFEYMPELKWHWAYPTLLVLMALAALGMVIYFRRRGWIGRTK